ncbi:hypothetical protein M430DRAFT_32691 [Amorphotheca resinae ATCC 22711]|jgi:glycine/D-amino acid oxidase-like deaminating enzyme|uniref:FAD dependent oxidoreductase domain-containing protein n=1 Tax=Amorphotheca resinae ATCC 22711 TaxID=857342 RepID=A0A2T3BFN8_AMORE|nr:hypothetical protein M430DRAFT_32691 [Amorphotheca resinae ATCC 22711]PSS28240.1 hypothetical protein M430DRAFT_32691 [Amorphotheca resinae ATCC 22711]
MEAKPKQIIILGAGVTGLQTALSLLTSPHQTSASPYKITLIASHVPGDVSIQYTSPWAGGHWRSHATLSASDSESREWDGRTYSYWMQLLKNGDGKEGESYEERVQRIGLAIKESRNYWGKASEETAAGGVGLWWRDVVEGFEVLDLQGGHWEQKGEKPPNGSVFAINYQSIAINVPQYLSYLEERATQLGARIIKSSVDVSNGLEGVVRDAKRILLSSDPSLSENSIFALVNATGLSARHFVGPEEAAKLYPARGQTILVKGEAQMCRTYVDDPSAKDDEITYVIPRPGSGTTILGGCKQAGSWEENVDEDLHARILERVEKHGMAEELRTGQGRSFEVLARQVGFRPGRKGGPRVELEERGGGNIDGIWVVHSYGHAGAGYQNSIGSAEKVVGLIEAL